MIAAVPFRAELADRAQLDRVGGRRAVSPGRDESDLKAVADRLIADADAALYRAKALGEIACKWGPDERCRCSA